jgi:cell division protein ZapE
MAQRAEFGGSALRQSCVIGDIRSRRVAEKRRIWPCPLRMAGISALMTEKLSEHLRAQIAAGELDADAAQLQVAQSLEALAEHLASWKRARPGLWSVLGGTRSEAPRGIYIHGPVGRGKTMLMDAFFELVPFEPKLRCHFHEFMADVHERIAKARKEHNGDPIAAVAAAIAEETGLLCFDELQVTDIADAMILGRLFKGLLAGKVVVVATSNAAPRELYKDGLNRLLFLPFVALIEENMDVVALEAAKDYRLEKLAGQPLYFVPADGQAREALDRHWERLTGGHPARAETLRVKGRDVIVPKASMGIARFDFKELCEVPLGALDYLHIAHAYHTLIVDNIPVLTRDRRDVARRFINLIDTLYDNGVCVIASAAAEPSDLYPEGDGSDAFERTVSRLMEMRSEGYLKSRHGAQAEKALP